MSDAYAPVSTKSTKNPYHLVYMKALRPTTRDGRLLARVINCFVTNVLCSCASESCQPHIDSEHGRIIAQKVYPDAPRPNTGMSTNLVLPGSYHVPCIVRGRYMSLYVHRVPPAPRHLATAYSSSLPTPLIDTNSDSKTKTAFAGIGPMACDP